MMFSAKAIEEQLKQTHAQYNKVVAQNRELQQELKPMRDPYFKNLSTDVIAELAKKSIRVTADNSDLFNLVQDIAEKINAIYGEEVNVYQVNNEKYVKVEDFKTVNNALFYINAKIKAYKEKSGTVFEFET